MININTKEKWDKYHTIHKVPLNYPEKFKFISRDLLKSAPKNARILDLGCGRGCLLKQIKEDHPDFQIVGLEFSKVAVEFVRTLGISAIECTIPSDLKNYSNYDVVIATEFLEHLEEKERIETLKEVYRILNKGGKAIFTVPNNILPHYEERFHLVCYNEEKFKDLLGQVFDFISVISKSFIVSDNPAPKGYEWANTPFLFGIGYKK